MLDTFDWRNSSKKYAGLYKAIVTRLDDPLELGRIQVCIPVLHGDVDASRSGTDKSLGTYPWAQMCTTVFKTANVDNSTVSVIDNVETDNAQDVLSPYLTSETPLPVVYPSVGDIVWIMFEDADCRTPVYMGSLATMLNNRTDDSLSYAYQGGTVQDITAQMFEYVDSYTSVTSDNGVTKVGMLKYKSNTLRDLLLEIKRRDGSTFNSILSGQSNFINMVSSTKSWGENIAIEGNLLNKVSTLLSSSAAVEIQRNHVKTFITTYVELARNYGVLEPKVVSYFSYLCLLDANMANKLIKRSGDNLDNLYNISITALPNFVNKLQSAYGWIVAHADLYLPETLPDEEEETEDDTKLAWFSPDCMTLVKTFGMYGTNYCPGIEVGSADAFGKAVIAAHSGTATFHYDYETALKKGFYVKITNEDTGMVSEYCYLSNFCGTSLSNANTNYSIKVTKGDRIGIIGQASEAEIPSALFILKINDELVNPSLYMVAGLIVK